MQVSLASLPPERAKRKGASCWSYAAQDHSDICFPFAGLGLKRNIVYMPDEDSTAELAPQCFLGCFILLETGLFCVTVLSVLELSPTPLLVVCFGLDCVAQADPNTLVDHAGLKHTEILLPLPLPLPL